ncbi:MULTISPECIES: dUTP pyrophosphatase [Enterococcus]|uniref:dUTP diphosphatase n=1 Tax=Enterococcus dispar ATCC 51266 TaxID=1139219 RepID=S0KJ81_9ENTE|nr:dUTP pyrophosphatase [Enterococcus dispar]EOT40168.1 dUTP pyrophosphatase [Enterococcus dispar ATCC 51266]EOW86549.1 dUTP pyrophosphatase [Enterococcus dispar ATCC 51266]MCU7357463.1 dUTP diphosphatase [Enterococcus dispar]MDT2705952.1 dUTP diphosphatase [Enterococcus dispar]OJG39486.1 dUTP pyrophosphatase [Enterococcus dispar]
MRTRGFEVVSQFLSQEIHLPKRATNHAAGYDFEAACDVVIPSIWHEGLLTGLKALKAKDESKFLKPVLVPTGIKAYMGEDEFLQLANRSSNPLKRFLVLTNGVGVIDSDYYDNPDNEGHIMFQFTNFGLTDVTIKKGERIGQGIFLPFLKADQDTTNALRTGGFGSSNK